MRILYVVHGHPKFSKGGAEISCYNLFAAAKAKGYQAYFVGRASSDLLQESDILKIESDEFIIAGQTPDYFFVQSENKKYSDKFIELVNNLNIEVIHFHHFIHLGLDWLLRVKASVPDVKIILTLHEYYAICPNNGQMVELQDNSLCYQSGFDKCSKCLGVSSERILFRKLLFKGAFSVVDKFVSPSEFLKSRYVDWGISKDKIEVIENGLDLSRYLGRTGSNHEFSNDKLHIGYFGQLTYFKGVDILLDAVALLPMTLKARICLNIHGANLKFLSERHRNELENKITSLGDIVTMHGKYETEEFIHLAKSNDFLVMPSRWWENSPVVIQEAKAAKVPIIVADIGGMKEKVIPGIDGLHFKAGDSADLSKVLTGLFNAIRGSSNFDPRQPYSNHESFALHEQLYLN